MNLKTECENELEICKQQILQLEKDHEELAKTLIKVNEKLHDSERLKGHFLSNITNEIVNPFSSVLALAQNIKQLKEGDIIQAHRMADLIFMEAFQLDFQLKNIFAAAMIEAGIEDIKRTTFVPDELGEQLGQYFEAFLLKKNIRLMIHCVNTLNPDKPISFISDKDKIDLILKNLISNSIKFSPENSSVELTIALFDGELTMEVSDHGKGISASDRKIIFDRFKQLDEKINSINTGHGLGLSIAQSFAEMLGGKVTLNDNIGGGLRLMVSIPEGIETDGWDDLEDFILDSEASFK